MSIARYYDESKNQDGAFFPGVPLRDIDTDEWDALTDRMRDSVDASSFYRKTKPPQSPPPTSPEE